MATPQPLFVIDAKGRKKGVLLSVKRYQELMASGRTEALMTLAAPRRSARFSG